MLIIFQVAGNFEESNVMNRGNGRLEVLIHFSEDIGNAAFCEPVPEVYAKDTTDLPQLIFFQWLTRVYR